MSAVIAICIGACIGALSRWRVGELARWQMGTWLNTQGAFLHPLAS